MARKLFHPRILVLGVLTLLCTGWLAPDFAAAACGDWLEHGGQRFGGGQGFGLAGLQRDSGLNSPVSPVTTDSAPRPCDGPSCRRAPAEPSPMVPVRLASDHVDQWGCFLTNLDFANRSSCEHVVPEDDAPPDRSWDLLDPPPRA